MQKPDAFHQHEALHMALFLAESSLTSISLSVLSTEAEADRGSSRRKNATRGIGAVAGTGYDGRERRTGTGPDSRI